MLNFDFFKRSQHWYIKIQNIETCEIENGKKYANIDEAVLTCFSAFPQQPKVPSTLRAQDGHLKSRQRCITSNSSPGNGSMLGSY